MTNYQNNHIPVLIKEVIEETIVQNKAIQDTDFVQIMDGTLGGGGYLFEVIKYLDSANKGFVIHTCDLDTMAIERVVNRLQTELNFEIADSDISNHNNQTTTTTLNHKSKTNQKVILYHLSFSELIKLPRLEFEAVILDLGFSTNQLELDQKGFSYLKVDEDLDLRYDSTRHNLTLAQHLRRFRNAEDLGKVIYTYSGEKFSMKIARSILQTLAENEKIEKVGDLVNAIEKGIPRADFRHKNSILSRVWQAFRIHVNEELKYLNDFMDIASTKVIQFGRIGIVNFHSLEDKIITQQFRTLSKQIELDDFGNKAQYFRHLSQRPIVPSEEEVSNNPKSRSAKLRLLEKLSI